MNAELKALELLFQRPLEPVFTTRDNGKAVFELPDNFYEDRYRNNTQEVSTRFSANVETKIPLRELTTIPNLTKIQKLDKKSQFSLFNSNHRDLATELIEYFLRAPNVQQFLSLAAFSK